jgi:hypothetical protein
MENNGCFVALLSSVKALRRNLESQKGQMDP